MINRLWENMSQIGLYLLIGASAIILNNIREWYSKRKKSSATYDIKKIVASDLHLYQLLSELRVLFDSDRVKLFQFRNGTYYLGGVSEQKMVLTHPVLKSGGISYPQGFSQLRDEVNVSRLTHMLSEVFSQELSIIQVDQLEKSPYTQQLFVANGTQTLLVCGVYGLDSKPVGILMLSWITAHQIKPNPTQANQLRWYVKQISAAITTRS